MAKRGTRLDLVLVERGLVPSRSRARAMILAGDVLVDGQQVSQAGTPVVEKQNVELKQKPRFVSRGGEKIDHALEAFDVDVAGKVVADLGACTGGFTDAVLQRGAQTVYAVDVGYGQLDFRLREDPRVVVMERTNARYLESLPERVDVVVIDVSFISLSHMFPVAGRVLGPDGCCVTLIKPQFEAGKGEVGKGGVVRDPAVHRTVLRNMMGYAQASAFRCDGLTASPLVGPAGNHEFLGVFRRNDSSGSDTAAIETMIEEALAEVRQQESEKP